MDDLNISCLPTDFVGVSRPSKKLECLYEKAKKAETECISNLDNMIKNVCSKYKQQFDREAEAVKTNLHNIKGLIKHALFDIRIKVNKNNEDNFDMRQFRVKFKQILEYVKEQHEFVQSFFSNLINMEKTKSTEITEALKKFYEDMQKVSLKLPHERDEIVNLEIEKANQTILCNTRNYVELKTQLQAEVQNYSKEALNEIRFIKECWKNSIRIESGQALEQEKYKFYSQMANPVQVLKQSAESVTKELEAINSVAKAAAAKTWLNNIRQTLGNLDQNAQKIMMHYKQSIIIVYNRYFQDLKVIEENMNELQFDQHIPDAQVENYTPNLEEINKIYEVDLETIQELWSALVAKMSNTLDNTHKFLTTAACLWNKHFRRTQELQIIMLRDVENLVKHHNAIVEPYETKLNILIDTLRQEPNGDRIEKTISDISKVLSEVEKTYDSQYNAELSVMKKYKGTQDLRIDVLLAEVKRFLLMYPPDATCDPKMQKKRASQQSIHVDPTEGLFPTQMLYCEYQIGALGNWQFGLWECINNYLNVAKTQILADTEKWIETHSSRLNRRLEIRKRIHLLRMENIHNYVQKERSEELCFHTNRFIEHKNAVEKKMAAIKDESKQCQALLNQKFIEFNDEISNIELNCLSTETVHDIITTRQNLTLATERCTNEVHNILSENTKKVEAFFSAVKGSHVILAENIKFFFEEGNFSVLEAKDYLKSVEKIEAQVQKMVQDINREIEVYKTQKIDYIRNRKNEINVIINDVLSEYKFVENMKKQVLSAQQDLIKGVCDSQMKLKGATGVMDKIKKDIFENWGQLKYFKTYSETVEIVTEKLKTIALFLDEAVPVRFYSDKSGVDLPLQPQPDLPNKTEEQVIHQFTSALFNLDLGEDRNTYFVELNRTLKTHWDNIILMAKKFYAEHGVRFYLSKGIQHSFDDCIRQMYETLLHMQNQCETRTMQDTKEFLDLATSYLDFFENINDSYLGNYASEMVKNVGIFFETNIKKTLLKNTNEIKDRYAKLQKKLKTIYGHPRNRNILEKLEIEAEIINHDASELSEGKCDTPLLQDLEDKFHQAIDDYNALTEMFPQVSQVLENFRISIEDLIIKFNKKLGLIRMMIESCPVENLSKKKSFLTRSLAVAHCKTFLSTFDMSNRSLGASTTVKTKSDSLNASVSIKFEYSERSFPSSNTKTLDRYTETTFNTSGDVFISDMRELFEKYKREISVNDVQETLKALKMEWRVAVNRVLDLYTVKYDQYKTKI